MAVHSIRAARPGASVVADLGVMEGTAYIRWDFFMLTATCHCGTVSVELPRRPPLLTNKYTGLAKAAAVDSSRLRTGCDVTYLWSQTSLPLQHVWILT